MQPPAYIDGTRVIEWAWSEIPFGVIRYSDGSGIAAQVHGLALCQFDGGREFYCFACNADWGCVGDFPHDSLELAKSEQPYRNVQPIWHSQSGLTPPSP
jgi:hypothetical protein